MHSLYSNIDFLVSECETFKQAAVQRNLAALATTTDEDSSDAETVQMMPEVFPLLGPNLKRLRQSTLAFSTTNSPNSPNSPPLNKKQK
jgi:ABC-type branched-subunit amino acid transport system ATPase component